MVYEERTGIEIAKTNEVSFSFVNDLHQCINTNRIQIVQRLRASHTCKRRGDLRRLLIAGCHWRPQIRIYNSTIVTMGVTKCRKSCYELEMATEGRQWKDNFETYNPRLFNQKWRLTMRFEVLQSNWKHWDE